MCEAMDCIAHNPMSMVGVVNGETLLWSQHK